MIQLNSQYSLEATLRTPSRSLKITTFEMIKEIFGLKIDTKA